MSQQSRLTVFGVVASVATLFCLEVYMKRLSKTVCSILTMTLLTALIPLSPLFSVPVTAAGDVAINEKNFPDKVFRTYVSENFDKDSNCSLSNAEIQAVTQIRVSSKGI